MALVKFTVDGQPVSVNATDPAMPLLYALRQDLGLSNPHFGCGLAQCGACTVHLRRDRRAAAARTPHARARRGRPGPRVKAAS